MKRWMTLVLTLCFVLGIQTTAFSATKISKVELDFAYDQEPASGNDVGNISAAAAPDAPYQVEYAEYVTNAEQWTVGDRPVVRVELSANGDYYFNSTSKSYFTLSGCDATFKSASRRDGNSILVLEVYLKRIGGKLGGVDELEWSGATAVWSPLYGAKSYEVRLLRGSTTVTTAVTQGTSYNFAKNISKAGEYTFRVRGIANYNDQAGEWSGDSDTFSVAKEDLDAIKNWTGSAAPAVSSPRGWLLANNIWYYFDSNGYRLTDWQFIDGCWYFMDGNGAMQVGWQFLNNQWYYFNPVSGGPQGAMTTGWQFVDNRWYYMNADGVMQVGWQLIGGKWYYLNPVSDGTKGAMYADAITPDGYRVDASGARIG